jgi:hypothetical protein
VAVVGAVGEGGDGGAVSQAFIFSLEK